MKRRYLILVGEAGLFFIESLVSRQIPLALAALLLFLVPFTGHGQLLDPERKKESESLNYKLPAQAFFLEAPFLASSWNPGVEIEGYRVLVKLKEKYQGVESVFAEFKTLEAASQFLDLLRNGSVRNVHFNLDPKMFNIYIGDLSMAPITGLSFFYDR